MTETWKPIPDWPWYEAGDQGRIKRNNRHKMSERSRKN
jgi:hypothetical protein